MGKVDAKPLNQPGGSPSISERQVLLRIVSEGKASWSGGQPLLLEPRLSVSGSPFCDAILEDREG